VQPHSVGGGELGVFEIEALRLPIPLRISHREEQHIAFEQFEPSAAEHLFIVS
jgi:hypothetical protein